MLAVQHTCAASDSALDVRPLPSPGLLRARLPVSTAQTTQLARHRQALADVLEGRDAHRLIVVVGPCSIHSRDAALAYARRLAPVAHAVRESCLVVMRTYFEKPRSTLGWKGLLNDPHLDGVGDLTSGIPLCREILVEISQLGLPCASELLDVMAAPFLSDLLSWAAIGARTSASQPHRELVSGLTLPVGFKNGIEGDLESAVGAVASARSPHHALAIGADGEASAIHTRGNRLGHLVLRGGRRGPNHDATSVTEATEAGRALGLTRPVVVDCSHGNSAKDHTRQADVCREVLAQVRSGQQGVAGVMLESHLAPGCQPFEPGRTDPRDLEPGVSITDACIGFDETERIIDEVASAVATARGAAML